MRTVKCDYCANEAKLVTGRKIYPHREDLWSLRFWQCEPCVAYVGCHKNSDAVPLGRLANASLRKAKMAAHAEFDPIWRDGLVGRKEAYAWLASQLGIHTDVCHIGMFDEEMCRKVAEICKNRDKSIIQDHNNVESLER